MKDRFSAESKKYAAFRPTYPAALYDFLLKNTPGRNMAWDCACGNGQVARDLSPHFQKVLATDISQNQLNNAFVSSNVWYSVCPAEKTPFEEHLFDLIAVGQALHWFKTDEFFAEARRVGRNGSTIAAWGYGLLKVDKALDPLIEDFYVNVVGPYWDKERRHIDECYASITFPFERIDAPQFDFSFEWTIGELEGYLNTWSSVQNYIHERGSNPVAPVIDQLRTTWQTGTRRVRFPLFVLAGRIA